MKTSIRKYTCDECGTTVQIPENDDDMPKGWHTVVVEVSDTRGLSVEEEVCSIRCAAARVTRAAKKLAESVG